MRSAKCIFLDELRVFRERQADFLWYQKCSGQQHQQYWQSDRPSKLLSCRHCGSAAAPDAPERKGIRPDEAHAAGEAAAAAMLARDLVAAERARMELRLRFPAGTGFAGCI